jgi:hypothetical protein
MYNSSVEGRIDYFKIYLTFWIKRLIIIKNVILAQKDKAVLEGTISLTFSV